MLASGFGVVRSLTNASTKNISIKSTLLANSFHSSSSLWAKNNYNAQKSKFQESHNNNNNVKPIKNRSFKEMIRRQRDKENFFGIMNPIIEDEENRTVIIGSGFNKAADINWLFASYDLTPSGVAFRNLHERGLIHLSKTRYDHKKGIELKSNGKYKNYTVGNKISNDQYEDLKREITNQMSESKYLFLQEGTISGAVTRVFTDSPQCALFFKKNLAPHQFIKSDDPNFTQTSEMLSQNQQVQLKVYISSAQINNLENYGIEDGINFSLYNKATGELFIIGDADTNSWKDIVTEVSSTADRTEVVNFLADNWVPGISYDKFYSAMLDGEGKNTKELEELQKNVLASLEQKEKKSMEELRPESIKEIEAFLTEARFQKLKKSLYRVAA